MPNVKNLYMIRQKSTGLFAKSGTSEDRWSKKGKIFDHGNLINHMKQFDYKNTGSKYVKAFPYPDDDTEILEIKVNLDIVPRFNPSEFLGGANRD